MAAAPGTHLTWPISEEKRGLETFPLGRGAVPPSKGSAGRRWGAQETRTTGVAGLWLGRQPRRWPAGASVRAVPCTLEHSFTLVAFIRSCSSPRRDKGAVGRRNPGVRKNWCRVTLEIAQPKSKNAVPAQNAPKQNCIEKDKLPPSPQSRCSSHHFTLQIETLTIACSETA